jgi:hypothetical protein
MTELLFFVGIVSNIFKIKPKKGDEQFLISKTKNKFILLTQK